MKYIDGFVVVVAKKNIPAYMKLSKKAGKIFREYGAIEYRESVGDDMKVKMGLPFPKLAKTKSNETVVFSWIAYKSRSHRDSVNKKVMKDTRLEKLCDPKKMPFDVKRMAYGGFQIKVDV